MSLLQQCGLGDSTSQQLTTTVTSLARFVPSIQKKVSACLVNDLNVRQSVLYKALRTFHKIDY
jgi:hypothetical protein